MFDDIIGSANKPDPAPHIKAIKGDVAEVNPLHILVIYVDPIDGEMYYFKYITRKKFKVGDEVEIVFESDKTSPQQMCDRWTIDGKRKDEIYIEQVKRIK